VLRCIGTATRPWLIASLVVALVTAGLVVAAASSRKDAAAPYDGVVVAIVPTVTPPGDYFNGFICAGVVLDPTTVMTAAHCLTLARGAPLDVVYGISNLCKPSGQENRISAIRASAISGYSGPGRSRDVALLSLRRMIRLRTPVSTDPNLSAPPILVGWGSSYLGGVPQCKRWISRGTAFSPAQCEQQLTAVTNAHFSPASEMCVGLRPDSCQGGSGSPLIKVDGSTVHLLGVLSWGVGCGRGYPAVVASVAGNVQRIATLRHELSSSAVAAPHLPGGS
jgi:secreted trypsin-like serine protease